MPTLDPLVQDIVARDKATPVLRGVSRESESLASASSDLGKAQRSAAVDAKELAESSGDLDSALKAVGGAVGVVSPELESLFVLTGDLLGGVEGLIRGKGALVGVLGSAATAIGVVSVALAAGAAAYSTYALETEIAADESGRLEERLLAIERVADGTAARIAGVKDESAKAAAIMGTLADRVSIATGEFTALQIEARNAARSVQTAFRGQELLAGQRVAGLEQQISLAEQQRAQALGEGTGAGVLRAAEIAGEIASLNAQLNRAEENLLETQAQTDEAVGKLLADFETLGEASEKSTTSARSSADADDDAARAARELAAAQDAAVNAARARADTEVAQGVAAAQTLEALILLDPALSDAERTYRQATRELDNLAAAVGQAALAGNLTAEEFAEALGIINRARADAEAARTATGATGGGTGADGILTADAVGQSVSGALSGSLSGILSPVLSAVLGPAGPLAASFIGLLEQGPEQVEALLDGLARKLPDAIGPALAVLASELPGAVAEGLVLAIPELPSIALNIAKLQPTQIGMEIAKSLILGAPEFFEAAGDRLLEFAETLPDRIEEGLLGGFLRAVIFDVVPAIGKELITLIPELVAAFGASFRIIITDALDRVLPGSDFGNPFQNLEITMDGRRVAQVLDRVRSSRFGGVT